MPKKQEPVVVEGDVIQLKPNHEWGPLLMIVDQVKAWGVRCYLETPVVRGGDANLFYLRVNYGEFVCIGPSAWYIGAPPE